MAREISKALDERLQSGSAQSANSSSRRKPEFHYGNPFYAEEEDIAKRRTPEAKEEGMGKVGGMDAAARAIAHQILEEDEDALADFFSASKKRKAFRTHNPCRAGARYLVKALPDYFHGLDRSERQALSEKVAHILLKAKPKDFPGFMGGSFGGGGGGNSWNDYTNAIP